jgi:hypothetical protein
VSGQNSLPLVSSRTVAKTATAASAVTKDVVNQLTDEYAAEHNVQNQPIESA